MGGLAGTEIFDGFSFDHAIHILYTADAYVASLISDTLLRGNLRRQTRHSYCYTAGRYTEYPYQTNNYGLPLDGSRGGAETMYPEYLLKKPQPHAKPPDKCERYCNCTGFNCSVTGRGGI